MASRIQFMIPGQATVRAGRESGEKGFTDGAIRRAFITISIFPTRNSDEVVTITVSDQIRETQILRKVFLLLYSSRKLNFPLFFFYGLLLNFYCIYNSFG